MVITYVDFTQLLPIASNSILQQLGQREENFRRSFFITSRRSILESWEQIEKGHTRVRPSPKLEPIS